LAVPARPGPSRPLARFLACPVVPLFWDNEGTSVPLSQKVALSRSVGNPSIDRCSLQKEFWTFHEEIVKFVTFNNPSLHRI
jgi:hypothetical protein